MLFLGGLPLIRSPMFCVHSGEEKRKKWDFLVPERLDRFWESLLQELDGGDEIILVDEHHQIDRVEVGFATKTTPQVSTLVDGGERFAALRTNEADPFASHFMRPLKGHQNVDDRDVVSHLVKHVSRIVFCHARPPDQGN
jgi:hypothetical protein